MKKIILISFVFISLCACQKKKGCTDSSATNFDSSAQKDDGSCTYNGKLIIWWKKSFADSCSANSVTDVKIYSDGVFQGACAVSSTYWPNAPACGANSTVTISKDLGTNKTKVISVSYKVTVNGIDSGMLGTQSETLQANTCITEELTW